MELVCRNMAIIVYIDTHSNIFDDKGYQRFIVARHRLVLQQIQTPGGEDCPHMVANQIAPAANLR